MAKSIVGVDISANRIRAAELSSLSKLKPTLVRYHSVPLPRDAVSRGEVLDGPVVAAALKRLWSTGGFTSKNVELGIGNSRVLARDFSVPRMPLSQIRESLPFHVQDLLPFPTEDALLDFYPINEGEGESGAVVHGLLVAALKDVVLSAVSAVRLAGLNPVDVDLIPFALSRVLLRGPQGQGTTAIVDVGASTTSVVIASDGVPHFVRIIPTGGDDITAAIAARLGVSLDVAERTKRELGLSATPSDATQHAAMTVIFELVGELLTNLRNTINYFLEARPGNSVRQILITGGGTALPGFPAALADFTRLPIAVGDPLHSVSVSNKVEFSDGVDAAHSGLSVAIGLALGSAA